jgi:hypothetical protein
VEKIKSLPIKPEVVKTEVVSKSTTAVTTGTTNSWSKVAAINADAVVVKKEVKKAEVKKKVKKEVKKEEVKKEEVKKEEVKEVKKEEVKEVKKVEKKRDASLSKKKSAEVLKKSVPVVVKVVEPVAPAVEETVPEPEPVQVIEPEAPVVVAEETVETEVVLPEPPKTPVLEEGEIVDDTQSLPPTTPTKPSIKTSYQTSTKSINVSPTATESPSLKKPPMTLKEKPKIEDFSTVVYPDSLTVTLPYKDDNGIIRYSHDFLMLFQTLNIPPPPSMPTIEQLTDDNKPQSPRGGRSNSNRQNSGGPVNMNRNGSTSESGGRHGSSPGMYTSGERYAMAKKSGLGMPQNTLIRGPQNPAQKMGRTGSNRGERGTPPARQGSQGQQRQQSGLWQPVPAPEPIERLEISDTAWQPKVSNKGAKQEALDEETANQETIFKKMRSLLNKLTLEKFDSISQKILDMGISSEAILQGVINLIFDKALDEPTFGGMYAQLCQFLSVNLPRVQGWIDMETRNNAFRRILLNKCQEEFESGQKWADQAESMAKEQKKADELPAEEREALMEKVFAINKAKRRALGNIHFIGELFKLQMLTEKIIHACISQLLRNITEPEEEDIESLCKLMTTVGQKLDHNKAKSYMDTYFQRLGELSRHMALPSRIRFMLKDLIDLRKSNWTLRALQAQSGPKTIAQIHEEAEKKKRMEEEENAKNQRGGNNRRNDRERSGYGGGGNSGSYRKDRGAQVERGGSQQQQQQDGWNVAGTGSKPVRQESIDMSKFGDIKKMSGMAGTGAFNLGPQTNYQMGSRGWSGKNEKKEVEPQVQRNAFAYVVL